MSKYYLGERAVTQLNKIMPFVLNLMKQKAGSSNTSHNLGLKKQYFLAKITSAGPEGESDYTDARYWIREVVCSSADDDSRSKPTFVYPEKPSTTNLSQWLQVARWLTAINLNEFSSDAHNLSTDDTTFVAVYYKIDQDGIPRYYFSPFSEVNSIRGGLIKDVFEESGPPSAHLYGGIYTDNIYAGWGGYEPDIPSASPSSSTAEPSSTPSSSADTEDNGIPCLQRHDENVVYLPMYVDTYVSVVHKKNTVTGLWEAVGVVAGEDTDNVLPP
tara:strand:+ start:1957 stop:2772 length:816 start_codon:yes stop_codon:yes gene_type:complete